MNSLDKILAIIPARSGSKGLRDKNIKPLNGKPMLGYTIEAAQKSNLFTDIIVSTDSIEYAKIAEKYGATVPYLRERQLATDQTKTSDVIIDILNKEEKKGNHYNLFMLLQPTSPLRDENDILKSFYLLKERKANAIVSICELEHPTGWNIVLDKEKCMDRFYHNDFMRQKGRKTYRLNGAIYLANVNYYLAYNSFYKNKCFAYIMPKERSVDVDDIFDFICAEAYMKCI